MYKPDKATTERNAKILRELVKQPDNKLCADCKRNDPRWASWNLGVYLCIRCSGIHRGMGTHISRVKSIDLDMWTPEQMESVQKWGNRRANLYWEAHLKAGHVPPDHKMESYIRSKYESKRWAIEGPPPSDPAVLENATQSTAAATTPAPLFDSPTTTTLSVTTPRPAPPSLHTPCTYRSTPAARQLLSATVAGRVPVAPAAHPSSQAHVQLPSPAQPQPQPQPQPQDDLFALDFHTPSTATTTAAAQAPAKNVKQDILSLFAAGSAPQVQPVNATAAASSPWAAAPQTQAHGQPQAISIMGTTGTGMWGVSSGWTGAPTSSSSANNGNIWGNPSTATNAFSVMNTNDIWGGVTQQQQPAPASKKDDVFGDLWGDFK